jgi:hypothetical protein
MPLKKPSTLMANVADATAPWCRNFYGAYWASPMSGSARLIAHLPQMLFDLKAGLGTIRYPERQVFLSWLLASHTAAIKGTGYDPEQPTLSALRKHFQAFIELNG